MDTASTDPTLQTPNPPSAPAPWRTRNGKVARLPKAMRDRVNWMMLDSIPYREIIDKLGPHGQHLTENCLTSWNDKLNLM